MLRFFIIFNILMQIVFAQTNAPFQNYKTKLIDVDKKEGKINDSELIFIGSTGIIMHSFDEQTSTIISQATVTKKDGTYAYVELRDFDSLSQEAFPSVGITPKKGDDIILNYLYERSLIIVPNEQIYKKIMKTFPSMQWIHPDLIAARLSINSKPNPNKHNFNVMCEQNSAGLIFFALSEKAYFVDCKNFKILKSISLPKVTSYQLPFYHRLNEIESLFWKIGDSQIEDYNSFYKKMLGLK